MFIRYLLIIYIIETKYMYSKLVKLNQVKITCAHFVNSFWYSYNKYL